MKLVELDAGNRELRAIVLNSPDLTMPIRRSHQQASHLSVISLMIHTRRAA